MQAPKWPGEGSRLQDGAVHGPAPLPVLHWETWGCGRASQAVHIWWDLLHWSNHRADVQWDCLSFSRGKLVWIFFCFVLMSVHTVQRVRYYWSSTLVTGHPHTSSMGYILLLMTAGLIIYLTLTCQSQSSASCIKLADLFFFAGGHWRIQWHHFCLWTNWKWEVFHHARSVRACSPEGRHSTSLWAHIWEYSSMDSFISCE